MVGLKKTRAIWKILPGEAIIWLAALALLAFLPVSSESHFSICPLAAAGFDHCPGCGLGRSVSLIMKGQLQNSFQEHPLGLFAIIILSYRVIILVRNSIKTIKTTE